MISNKMQRHRFILFSIQREGTVTVSFLAKYLGVSERTIRRDLNDLEGIGRVKCFYGGAEVIRDAEFKLFSGDETSPYKNMKINNNPLKKMDALMSEKNKKNGKVFVLGSFNTDLVYRIANLFTLGQTIQATNCYCLPGGKGSNQAIASVMAEAKTNFAVKLGDDEFAKRAMQFLKGVAFEQLITFEGKNCSTGSAVVMVSENEGDNAIVINPGANQLITDEDVISCYASISESDVFLTQMENNFSAIYMSLKLAKADGIQTILNPAPWKKDVEQLLQFVDYLTPNLTEAESIVGRKLQSTDEIIIAAEEIHNKGVKNVIITLGKEGCWYYNGMLHRHFSSFTAVNIDTSGAGDAFNGAFAARIAAGDNVETAIIYANAFASLAVEREGASNMPSHSAALQRITNS
ncbi:DeoR family transcriptional regulator [Klebsiella pneumoniae]|uniref:PfkB family carbohydrate kinase n=1 Tax=Klebsiella TaxID=570 RepID=UPI001EE9C10A|nr:MULTISPECIES: PfkB family carbohydrate kinase [Klebsiella]EKU9431589.1 DeoR family transcriptional regulator [Klebsiella variicola]MBZ6674032.1 DeoR family transcriptional regulator [Klebsiella pneumoniae]MBZ7249436.1 DeoR family transcriptional regulator [Klebsiella pneumoniae]UXO81845.1 PfkB family carbohydrate kinase [Klebsiella michiganensis]